MAPPKPQDSDPPGFTPESVPSLDPADRSTEKIDPARHPQALIESLIGRTLSQYTITDRLGQGGMGVVYKARDDRLDRYVALKFLSPQLISEPQAKQRFLREAQAAASLDDPHICTVHDISEVDGLTFIVMNYVEGESLKDRIAARPPSVKEALEFTLQIAKGLSRAHHQGIVHRDIKPGNILLTPDDQVKIADFGLAKLVTQTRLTRTGAAVGTLAYMSPEQTQGEDADQRADIWSLGVVLYEMLTGALPFRGDNERAMVRSITRKAPKPISDFRPEVPLDLERLVEKTLSKRPGKRYQDVDTLIRDLEEMARTLDLEAPPTWIVRIERFFWKRSTRRAITAVAGLAALAGALWITTQILPPKTAPRIMVAKWENATGRADLDWVSGALMSGLIQTLGDVRGYNVISRQTVAATVDALQMASASLSIPYGTAREIGASYLVSGTFRTEGGWLVLDCELTNVASEGVVVDSWSLELADSTRIQEAVVELAVDVASALGASWEQDPRTTPPIQLTPSTAALKYYEQALAAEELHRYAEAEQDFFKALDHDSTFAEAHYGVARVTMEKDVEQKHYTLAMKYRLRSPPLTRKLIEAQGLLWDSKIDPAITMYEEILREDPEQINARKQLAYLYDVQRRFSEALAEYTIVHQISPLDFTYYGEWATSLVRNGKPDQALELIDDWRRRFPDQDEPFNEYLVLCSRISRYREGVALCDSVAGLDPEALPFSCGWLYERVGRLSEAEQIFLRLAADPDPGLPSTRGNAYLAWLAYREQDYERGIGYIDKALAKWDNSWYRWLAGTLAARAGRTDLAREHAAAILRLNPEVADTTVAEAIGDRRWYYHLLGLIDLVEGRPREAIARFNRVLQYTTLFDEPEFRTYLGRAYIAAGNLDEAATQLELVRAATPTYPEARLYLGYTYVLKKDYDRATEVLRELEDLWSRADADDPLNMELKRLLDAASARR